MVDPLDPLVADGIIDEVLTRLKSGKEADIYLVQHAGEIVAAKVYKERHVRSFKNNAEYKEGRAVRNTRTARAMQKGSRFGRAADEEAWKTKESEALEKLFAEGLRVPKPHLFYEGVLLMETVVDPDGHPAPRLIDASIPREQAAELYADLRQQIIRMLMCDLIHGDLSPYNVLLAWNGPTIIDFPQVVGAAHNSKAEFFFSRDLETIRRFFAAIDPSLQNRSGDAWEIWRAYVKRELNADFVPTGKAAPKGGPSREAHAAGPRREIHVAQPAHSPRREGGGHTPRKDRGGAGQAPPGRRDGQRRDGAPPPREGSGHRARDGAARSGTTNGPAVSYVGKSSPEAPLSAAPKHAPADAAAPAGNRPRRRRRRRGGGGGGNRPPSGGGNASTS